MDWNSLRENITSPMLPISNIRRNGCESASEKKNNRACYPTDQTYLEDEQLIFICIVSVVPVRFILCHSVAAGCRYRFSYHCIHSRSRSVAVRVGALKRTWAVARGTI